jgi:hypothetical protein
MTTEVVLPYKRLPLTPEGKIIERRKKILKSPRTQVIISFPKSGKTDSMIDQPKFFIGDCEGGTDKFEGINYTDLTKSVTEQSYAVTKGGSFIPSGLYEVCQELYRANNMKAFNKAYERFNDSKSEEDYAEMMELINVMPFPVFVVDTITSFMKMVYHAALAVYNANVDPTRQKTDIRKADNFGGTQFIRRKVEDIKAFIEKSAAPFIIYNGHIKMRKSVLSKTEEEISTVDMALEGQLPLIFTHTADAVCIFYRNEEGCFLDYTKKNDSDTDARPRHLGNRILKISELHQFGMNEQEEQYLIQKGKTYWNRIYPELQF